MPKTFIVAAVILFGVVGLTSCSRTQAPNQNDEFFLNVAFYLHAPDVCNKIGPRAIGGKGGLSPTGYQISYMRSDCYRDLAVELHDATLCEQVRPARTFFLDGSKETPSECRSRLNGPPIIMFPLSRDAFVNAMRSLGYTIGTEPNNGFNGYWAFFQTLANKDPKASERLEFLERVREMR